MHTDSQLSLDQAVQAQDRNFMLLHFQDKSLGDRFCERIYFPGFGIGKDSQQRSRKYRGIKINEKEGGQDNGSRNQRAGCGKSTAGKGIGKD